MRSTFSILLLLLLSGVLYPPALTIHQVGPSVPTGFNVEVFFAGLHNPTSMAWGPDGNLYVSEQSGGIVEVIVDERGVPVNSVQIARVPPTLLGLVFAGQDLFVSYTGTVAKLTLRNGSVAATDIILSGLPHGRHQNDEIIYGKDGFLYVGIGSTGDWTNGNDPRSATIVRFKPDGSAFEIFAKGLRNPYGLAFDKDGDLFATDNGPDNPDGPDELNYIVRGGDYGFPKYSGVPPPGSGTIGPVTNLQTHSSADGFTFYYGTQFPPEYMGNAFIAEWGANSGDPNIGKRVVRVPITRSDQGFVGKEIVFATGFDRPLDVIEDHKGGLILADHGTGQLYRISYGPVSVTTYSSPSTVFSTLSSNIATPTTLEPLALEVLLLSVAVVLSVVLIVMRNRSKKPE